MTFQAKNYEEISSHILSLKQVVKSETWLKIITNHSPNRIIPRESIVIENMQMQHPRL